MATYEDQLELESLIRDANSRMDPRGLSERFKSILDERLKKKKKDPLVDVQPETTGPKGRSRVEYGEIDPKLFESGEGDSGKSSLFSSVVSGLDKGIDFLNEPLSGGYFGRLQRERAKEFDNAPEIIKHTGGQNKLQDFAATIAAMGQGFKRGVFEGAGDAADSLTAPSTWLSLAGGGLASKLTKAPKAAKAVMNAVRGIEATQIPHGIETMYKSDNPLDTFFGGLEAVGGAAGAFTPAAIAPRPGATRVDSSTVGTGVPPGARNVTPSQRRLNPQPQRQLTDSPQRLLTAGDEIVPPPDPYKLDIASGPSSRGDEGIMNLLNDTLRKRGMNQPEPPSDLGDVPVLDDIPAKQVDDIDAPWDDEVLASPETENIVDKLFPGLKTRERTRSFSFDEGQPFIERARNFFKDEKGEIDFSKLFQGEDDLGYNVRTNDPDAIDLGEIPKEPIFGRRGVANMEPEMEGGLPKLQTPRAVQGESFIDFVRRYLYSEESPFYEKKTQWNPGTRTDMSNAEIIESYNNLPPNVRNGAMAMWEETKAKANNPPAEVVRPSRFKRLLGNEQGAIGRNIDDPALDVSDVTKNPANRSPFGDLNQQGKDTIINRKFGTPEGPTGEPARTGLRRLISRVQKMVGKEDYSALPDDDWRAKFGNTRSEHLSYDFDDAINYLKSQGGSIPEQKVESDKIIQLLENAKAEMLQKKSTTHLEKLRDFFNDEQGAVGSRAYAMKKTYDSLVAENAPDKAFAQVVGGAKPIQGQTYKQLAEEYINFYTKAEAEQARPKPAVKENKGAKERGIKAVDPNGEVTPLTVTKAEIAEVRRDPQYADLTDDQIADAILEIKREDLGATQGTTVDAAEAKAAQPKLTKSGKVVKEAPLSENAVPAKRVETEDEIIARLEREVGINAQREADAARAAGEVEMDEGQLSSFRTRMDEQQAQRYAPEEVPDPAPRDGMPLLRRKSLGELNFPPKGRIKGQGKPGLGNRLQQLLRDEKGEINFEAMFRPDIRQFDESIPQLGPDAVSPRFEERGTRGFDEARLSELMDKNIAGTLTGDELDEGKTLYSRMRDFWNDERGEIDFSELLGSPTNSRNVMEEQQFMAADDLDPNVPIQERNIPELDKPSFARKLWDSTMGIPATDLPFLTSAAFRQASPLAWTSNWFKAWPDAMKSYGSQGAYDALMNEIMSKRGFQPRYREKLNARGEVTGYIEQPSLAEKAGIQMHDKINGREEALRGSLVEKIPGIGNLVKRSNRAYAAFLNSLRANKFEEMLDQAEWIGDNPEVNEKLLETIGETINILTGRASLKGKYPLSGGKEWNFEKIGSELATAIWSPKLLMSKYKMLNVLNYPNMEPTMRKELIKGLFRSGATWAGFLGLAKLHPDVEISMDPNNADFAKIKIGNTRIDPGGGMQQLVVLANRMRPGLLGGTYHKGEAGPFAAKPKTTAERFMANKMHPSMRLAYDLLNVDKDNPVHLGDRAVQFALPLMTQDIMDVMKEDQALGAAIGPLSSIGLGTQNYGKGDFKKPVYTDDIEKFLDMDQGSLAGTIKKW